MRYISIALILLLSACNPAAVQRNPPPPWLFQSQPVPQFQAPNFQRHNGTNCYPSGFGSISCYNY